MIRPKKLAVLLAATILPTAGARAAGPNEPPTPAPVSNEPQQTSATFGDWVVRCDRPAQAGARRVCEVAQSLVVQGQGAPIAQVAFGRAPGAGDKGGDTALTLTALLPVSIAFDKPPRIGPGASADEPGATTLTFRRCLPGGCLADGKPDAAVMAALRAAPKPGHLTFTDAAERTLTLPLSFRGLPQALDAMAKEAGKDTAAGR